MRNPAWAELVQLLPVIVLASSFVVGGAVDLQRAAPLFLVGALLTVPVHALVWWRGYRANPILLGAALWLWAGALGFDGPLPGLATLLGETRAVGLFVGAVVVGVVATAASPAGYVGHASEDRGWVLKASLGLLALTAACAAWSWVFRENVRLGGGLPFIVLNVSRRVTIARSGR